jgi:hypothetical protein
MAHKGTYNTKTGKRKVNASAKKASQRVKDARAAGFKTTSKFTDSVRSGKTARPSSGSTDVSEGTRRSMARSLQGGTSALTPESLSSVEALNLPTRQNVTNNIDSGVINAGLATDGMTGGLFNIPKTGAGASELAATNSMNALGGQIESYLGLARPDANANENAIADSRRQAGVDAAQQEFNRYSNQINTITANRDASQLSLEGQGRGITDTLIGGQQAKIGREAAIQALPIQAQLAAAQGNLEQANALMGQLYQAKSADISADLSYRQNLASSVMSFATTAQQTILQARMSDNAQASATAQSNLAFQRQLSMQALEFGQNGLISSISAVDPKSPTFESDMASFTSQLRKPVVGGGFTVSPSGEAISIPTFDDFINEKQEELQMSLSPEAREGYRAEFEGEIDVINQTNSMNKLSPLAREIVKNPKGYFDLTPTIRGEILEEMAVAGIDTAQIQAGKKRKLSTTQTDDLIQAQIARKGVVELKSKLDKLIETGPIVGGVRRLNPYDSEVVAIMAELTRIVPGLARGIYKEVGVLTDTDIERYLGTLANPSATATQIEQLHNDTMAKVNQSISIAASTYSDLGYDLGTFDFEAITGPQKDSLSDDDAYAEYQKLTQNQ